MSAWNPSRWRIPLGFALAAIYLWRAHPDATSLAVGLPLAVCGLVLRATAAGYIEKNALLTVSGPYRWTRNPLYLGSLLLAAGFILAARDWVAAVLALLLLTAVYLPVIRQEEAFLAQRFPLQFAAYARSVPRFWPRRPPSAQPAQQLTFFSWSRYLRHREYNALLGFLLVMAALMVKLLWRVHFG